jgi:hypothetical protein
MTQVLCTLDGGPETEAAARAAFAQATRNGRAITLVGHVKTPRFEAPQPAIGERIRRFQRVEGQLVRLAREARANGLDVLVVLPGHEVPTRQTRRPETAFALRPAAA